MRRIALVLLLLASATPARAQLQTGNLYGTIVDEQGSPLPGATVTLSGPGTPQVQVTNAQGQFRFLDVPPGSGQIKAELKGFTTVEYPNLNIQVGRNTTIEVTLSSAVEDVITVTAEAPLLDERRSVTGPPTATVSETELEKIPTARDPWAILQQTPGVLTDRINVGGNEAPPDDVAPPDPAIDPMEAFAKIFAGQDVVQKSTDSPTGVVTGANGDPFRIHVGYGPPPTGLPAAGGPVWVATPRDPWAILQQTPGVLMDRINVGGNEAGQQSQYLGPGQSTFSVDGIVITDMAALGSSPGYYDFDSFEEMQLSTGGTDPKLATGGVVLNMVTKRGTNEWRGSGRYFISDQDWQGAQNRAVEDYGAELGGPIIKDRLWIWGSYGTQQVDLLAPQTGQGQVINDVPVSNPFYRFIERLSQRGYTRGCEVPGMNVFTTPGTDCGPIKISLQNTYGTGAFQGVFPDPFALPKVGISSDTPLYVVNGVQMSPAHIPPDAVQDVEVLSGGAATALYGSAGANGVILITTKQPGEAGGGGFGSIAVDPSDPSGNTVYASGITGGIWKTNNFLTTDPNGPQWVTLPQETTWNKSRFGPDPNSYKIEDTHIFSSNFYLTGLYSKVNGGFQLTPQGGSGGVVEIDQQEMTNGNVFAGWVPTTVPGTPVTSGGMRSFFVFERNNFIPCPNGGFMLQGNLENPVDLGNGSSFQPFSSSFQQYNTERPQEQYRADCSNFFNTGNLSHELKFGAGYREAEVPTSGGTWFIGGPAVKEEPKPTGDQPVAQAADAVAQQDPYLQDTLTTGNLTVNLGLRYDPDEAGIPATPVNPAIFNPVFLNGFPTIPLSQTFGGRFRLRSNGGQSRAAGQVGPGGSLPVTTPGAPDGPSVLLVSNGQSTGDAFTAHVLSDAPFAIEGYAVLEPVAAPAAEVTRLAGEMDTAGAVQAVVEAYCFQFAGQVPAAGAAYRFAPPEVQQAFAPLTKVLDAAERVKDLGGLVPDTALDSYFPAISQWAVWAKEKGFDLESFGDAWLEHVKKNVEQAGERWTEELEQVVKERVPGRWRDIEKILVAAGE